MTSEFSLHDYTTVEDMYNMLELLYKIPLEDETMKNARVLLAKLKFQIDGEE